jgi:transglutaminase-like putative cysteine protease
MKRFRIVHTTEYRFEEDAFHFDLLGRLRPRDEAGQQCEYFQIVSRPPGSLLVLPLDTFGNHGHRLQIDHHLQRLHISAISTVARFDTRQASPVRAKGARIDDRQVSSAELSPYLRATRLIPLSATIHAYAAQILDRNRSIHAQAEALCRRIHVDLTFRAGVTHDRTNAEEVLAFRQGVCQDYTHLALACVRSLGWAARYVSGYVHTAAFRGKAHRIAADASHAWIEVFDPEGGWLGLDPTNNCQADDHYIVVARGRDYNDASPLQGTLEGGGGQQIRVSVDVQQLTNGVPVKSSNG